MPLKSTTLLAAVVAGSALLVTNAASAAQEDAATGGGQVLIGDGGAGDTIAFTAEGNAQEGTGQVQYVDREGGTGQDQTVRHATVTCISVEGNVARISGTWRDDNSTFGLYVEDNGEGAAADDDVIALVPDEPMCDFDPDDDDMMALARGNAQVRDRG